MNPFAILLRPSEWDWDDEKFIVMPFWQRGVIFLRFGLGGPWGCLGIEFKRPDMSCMKIVRELRRRLWYALDCPPTIRRGLMRKVTGR